MDVYLDAAFFPKLRREDFLQEGWRLEHADPHDTATPIVYKGVVYNEMKGVLSSGDALFSMEAGRRLRPGTEYVHISGGDPAEIPTLTWDALRAFHAEHYHPSASHFYTYGDLPLALHLERIGGSVIERFEPLPAAPPRAHTARWDEPPPPGLATCPPDPVMDPERQCRASVGFLFPAGLSEDETFKLRVVVRGAGAACAAAAAS